MKQTVINLDAYRNELAREILQTDNIEVLNKVRRIFQRTIVTSEAAEEKAPSSRIVPPYTMEELKKRTECSRADIAAGRVNTWDEANRKLKEELLWLK